MGEVDTEDVRLAVYASFAGRGVPPTTEELAADLGGPAAEVSRALEDLAAARHVVLDRAQEPDWSSLEGRWDAVVDVARSPVWVRGALDGLADRADHWTFVSSISVYADLTTPGGSVETTPLLEPITEEKPPRLSVRLMFSSAFTALLA